MLLTDLRFSKDSSYDGTDALEIVRRFCKHTPAFLSTTGIVDDYSEFSSIVDKNPKKALSKYTKLWARVIMSNKAKFRHDIRNCLINLETIALNINDDLYEKEQAVNSLLELKKQFEDLLIKELDGFNE